MLGVSEYGDMPRASKEGHQLKRGETATELADAAGDGVLDLQEEDDADAVRALDLLGTDLQNERRYTFHQLPVYKPKRRAQRKKPADQKLPFAPFAHEANTAGLFNGVLPEPDDDTEDGVGKSRAEPANPELCHDLELAANDLLVSDPCMVLRNMLDRMLSKSATALWLAPYMLAMHSKIPGSDMTAYDIEKGAVTPKMASWPCYATQAAAGVSTVIFMTEAGIATASGAEAVQVFESLEQKQEAISGLQHDGSRSEQFCIGEKARKVNAAMFRIIESPERKRQPHQRVTVRGAVRRCVRSIEGSISLTHSPSGFDERACMKTLLISKAMLHMGHEQLSSSPQEAACQAANRLRTSERLPVFFPGFRPLRLLLNVLWGMLQTSNKYKGLMERAKRVEVKCLPAGLEWAAEV